MVKWWPFAVGRASAPGPVSLEVDNADARTGQA